MKFVRSAPLVLFCLLAGTAAAAQSDFRSQLFGEANTALARAKEANAAMLAPRSFDRGKVAYTRAEDSFTHHRPVGEIREQLHLSAVAFTESVKASKTAQAEFETTLKARTDAIAADAMHASPGPWAQAEDLLLYAAASLEDGDRRTACSDAADAQGLYRSAELEAITENLLKPTAALIERAEQMNVGSTAQKTLGRAHRLLDLAEAMLKQNRYEIADAQHLAAEARYEAAHAIYLHEVISQLADHTTSFEDALLLSESAIGQIAAALNTHVRFDGGYEPVVEQIIAAVASRDSARAGLADSLSRLRDDNEILRHRLAALEPGGPTARTSRADESRKAEARRQENSAIARASVLFSENEAKVLRDGRAIVVRIYGLEFTPGKGVLAEGSAALLAKIEHAIRLFPDSRVKVEGHTEAGESETENRNVSAARAEAVATFLRSFPSPANVIESEGWGSSRPLADNTNAEGRARNRRIDIVIIPNPTVVRP